ncbi:aldo/keto reductase [Pedobacter agri]|uniref:aldo/keto reductase n=1 Tax=Pedobacter agri TaxID=454586 RepID=UPI002930507A|nr:aldo/keto reductase [Pedobacter agri]
MEKRKLGLQGLEVSALGYGCMGLSHAYGTALDERIAVQRIHEAYDSGYTFFDTAEVYVGKFKDGTPAINEEVVGKALSSLRGKVLIATKGGLSWEGKNTIPDGSRASIRKSVENSLRRLGIDVIDLYYQHRQDESVEAESVAETMSELIDEGKIRYWGISNASLEYILRADKVCKVSAVQLRYSMMARKSELMFPALDERGIGVVAYSPIANGFLSGDIKTSDQYDKEHDFRSFMPQYQKEEIAKSAVLLDTITRLGEEKNATPAQISLAWMLNKKSFIVPIPGTTKLERIKENAQSANVVLSATEIQSLDEALDGLDLRVFGGV